MEKSYSYSQIECFENCPFQYFLRYVKKHKVTANPTHDNALILGNTMHYAIQDENKAILYYKLQFNTPLMCEHYVELEKALIMARKIKKYIDTYYPNGKFEQKFINANYNIVGYLDYITNDTHIDFKYSNDPIRYEDSKQLHFYNYHKPRKNLIFIVAPKIKIEKPDSMTDAEYIEKSIREAEEAKLTMVKQTYDEDKVYKCFAILNRIKDACVKVNFPKNETVLCGWCSYQKSCKDGYNYIYEDYLVSDLHGVLPLKE